MSFGSGVHSAKALHAEASSMRLGCHCMLVGMPACPLMTCTMLPLAVLHIQMLLSAQPAQHGLVTWLYTSPTEQDLGLFW